MDLCKKSYDLVVVGGGIFGLWVAKCAADRGLRVLLAEERHIGAGASGGLLGVLMPHTPDSWNEKKQFQFDALAGLEPLIRELEGETGLRAGYRRSGRLTPVRVESFVKTARGWEEKAPAFWGGHDDAFSFAVHADARFENWLDPEKAVFGYVLDTLSARVDPRAYLGVLKAYLASRVALCEGWRFETFQDGAAYFANGAKVPAGALVLAQGYRTFSYLRMRYGLDIGTGIKGQAAQFALSGFEAMPAIFDHGVYVVPHENGTCAVGATAQAEWDDPDAPDWAETGFIDRAMALCPPLRNARLVGRWAGVRPKCYLRDPAVGRLCEESPVYVATGGFKVSFGIAHRVAQALADEIAGNAARVALPPSFAAGYHLSGCRSNR